MQLTVKALRPVARGKDGKLRADKWLSDGAVRGSGALWARCGASGVSLYFRYTDSGGRKRSFALGGYDQEGAKGLTLSQAREKAGELSKLYRGGVRNLHEYVERERAAQERKYRDEQETARRAAEDKQRGTLRELLNTYIGHLERQGKYSAADARYILNRHVIEPAPDLAARKALDLSVDDFVGLIGRLVEKGSGRTAAKLRSYLRAAYQMAIKSRTDPTIPLALRTFGITINPIASIGALSKFNTPRTRVLSKSELGAFLRRVDAMPTSAQKDALHLLLYLGGQRPVQLLRAKPIDVDLDAAIVTLYDNKGARSQPRLHILPLISDAAAIFKRRLDHLSPDAPVFSTDGQNGMRIETMSTLVTGISKAMVTACEAREPFQLRDLRRTCETMLAALGVSREVRAQLQSHGLGGVQYRHYDRHDYMVEKRQALKKWARQMATLMADKPAD